MQIRVGRWVISCLLAGLVALAGCTRGSTQAGGQGNSDAVAVSPSPTESVVASPSSVSEIGAQFRNLPRLAGSATVQLLVKGSPIIIQVDGANAPITAGNFVDLANRGVYNGLPFHRIVRDPQPFVVQGGDPQGRDPNFPTDRLGTGSFIDPATSQPRYVPLEIKPSGENQPIVYSKTFETAGINKAPKLRHTRGAVAMARSKPPDSASSQFYIALSDLEFLDGNYAVFGYVTSGMNIVDQIQQGDRITTAQVIEGIDNLKPAGAQ